MKKKPLNHIQRQYVKWCHYMFKCKDDKKRDKIFKQVLILNVWVARERE